MNLKAFLLKAAILSSDHPKDTPGDAWGSRGLAKWSREPSTPFNPVCVVSSRGPERYLCLHKHFIAPSDTDKGQRINMS